MGTALVVSCLRLVGQPVGMAPDQRSTSELPGPQDSQANQSHSWAGLHPQRPSSVVGVSFPTQGQCPRLSVQGHSGSAGQAPVPLPGATLTVVACAARSFR